MVKLTQDRDRDGALVVRVEGRLEAEGVQDLRTVCAGGPRGVLDLAGLRGADEDGWMLLRSLKGAGWGIAGASLFASRVLEEAGS